MQVLKAYATAFLNDVAIDQKNDNASANAYVTIENFSKTLDKNLDKFVINKSIYFKNLNQLYDLVELSKVN